MRDKQPLKQILAGARSHWDRAETRPAVRWAVRMQPKTASLEREK
jgi:hypothetical protein